MIKKWGIESKANDFMIFFKYHKLDADGQERVLKDSVKISQILDKQKSAKHAQIFYQIIDKTNAEAMDEQVMDDNMDMFSESDLEEMFTDIFAFLFMKKKNKLKKQDLMKKKKAKLFEEGIHEDEIPPESDMEESQSLMGNADEEDGADSEMLMKDGDRSNTELFEDGVDFFQS